jgi:hypothetical protein
MFKKITYTMLKINKSGIIIILMLTCQMAMAQNIIYGESVELPANQKEVLEKKYSEIQAIRLDKTLINFKLQQKDTTDLELQWNGNSVPLTLYKKEIRSPNYVMMYTNAEGQRIIETGGNEIHTFQGYIHKDTTQWVAAYSTQDYLNITAYTEKGTYELLALSEALPEWTGKEEVFVWVKHIEQVTDVIKPIEDCEGVDCTKFFCGTAYVEAQKKLNQKLFIEVSVEVASNKVKDPLNPTTKEIDFFKNVIKNVAVAYKRDIGVNIQLVAIYVCKDANDHIPECSAGDFVFKIKDLPSGTAASAVTNGAICTSKPAIAVGGFSSVTFSHELAHTLGASHDCCCEGIMYTDDIKECTTGVGWGKILGFSKKSICEIVNLSAFKCLKNDYDQGTKNFEWIFGDPSLGDGSICSSPKSYYINIPVGFTLVAPSNGALQGNSNKKLLLGPGLTQILAPGSSSSSNPFPVGPFKIKASGTSLDSWIGIIVADCYGIESVVKKAIHIGYPFAPEIYSSTSPIFGNGGAPQAWSVNLLVLPQVGVTTYDANVTINNSTFFSGATTSNILIDNQKFQGPKPPCVKATVSATSCAKTVTSTLSTNCQSNTDYTVSNHGSNIAQTQDEFDFSFAPNPANDYLDIRWSLDKQATNLPVQLTLTDTNGKLIVEKSLSAKENSYLLPTLSLPNGVYFITLSDTQHQSIKKLMVQHD